MADTRLSALEVFDRTADRYLDNYARRDPEGAAFVIRRRRVAALLGGVTRGPVLDVGCGPGVMADDVRARGFDYVGVDAAPGMIRRALERYGKADGLEFGVADIAALPFEDRRFGAVLCMGVLEYLRDPEAALDEMLRVTQAGGLLVVTLPNGASPYRRWTHGVYAPVTSGIKRALGRGSAAAMFRQEFDLASWTRAVAARGHAIEALIGYGYNPLLPPLDRLFPRVAARAAAALQRLGEGAARGWGTGFIAGVRVRA